MNLNELDLAGHPVIQELTRRIETLEAQLRKDHEKLAKLEHEHEHDHAVIDKIEHNTAIPTRVTVGL